MHYSSELRFHLNYPIIADMIETGSKVLDLGCGNGALLKMLKDEKQVKGIGIEISQDEVIKCIEKGLSVIQGDIDEGLKQFPSKSYDYVVLNRTLQAVNNPEYVIQEMLRTGKKCIVSFPNFAYWKVRANFCLTGRMPKSKILPFEWYNTPNIHLLTIKDFFDYQKTHNFEIAKSIYTEQSKACSGILYSMAANLLAEEVIFVIQEK